MWRQKSLAVIFPSLFFSWVECGQACPFPPPPPPPASRVRARGHGRKHTPHPRSPTAHTPVSRAGTSHSCQWSTHVNKSSHHQHSGPQSHWVVAVAQAAGPPEPTSPNSASSPPGILNFTQRRGRENNKLRVFKCYTELRLQSSSNGVSHAASTLAALSLHHNHHDLGVQDSPIHRAHHPSPPVALPPRARALAVPHNHRLRRLQALGEEFVPRVSSGRGGARAVRGI